MNYLLLTLKNEQDLSYTRLYAPFDAKVSQRLVENNSFGKIRTAIARLQDVSKIYFNINVPERTYRQHRAWHYKRVPLATNRSQWYPVTYVEHSPQPDPAYLKPARSSIRHGASKRITTPLVLEQWLK